MDEARWLDTQAKKISRRLGVEFDDARQTLALYRAKGEVHQYAFLHAYRELRTDFDKKPWRLHEELMDVRACRDDPVVFDEIWPDLDERMQRLVAAHLLGLDQEQIGRRLNISARQVRRLKTELIKRIAENN